MVNVVKGLGESLYGSYKKFNQRCLSKCRKKVTLEDLKARIRQSMLFMQKTQYINKVVPSDNLDNHKIDKDIYEKAKTVKINS